MDLKLLKKYFENKCSLEEARLVLHWIERKDASIDLEGELKNAWQKIDVLPGNYLKRSGDLKKIHERIEMEELYGSLNLDDNKSNYHPKDRPSKSGYELQKHSGKSKFKYFVSGLLAAAIVAIMIVAYIQFPKKVESLPEIAQVEKVTESGQKLSFHLEDGTKIILNAGSKLIYPSKFGIDERTVLLEGEAFFDVAKDITRPFKVITESIVTTALGTSFNINAFQSREKIEIALVTGQVSVNGISDELNAIFLDPGEMATVLKQDQKLTKSSFDFNLQVSWKDGLIYFKDAGYYEIVSNLKSWYGINIYANKVPEKEWKFSGKFEDETLENILIALQFGHEFEYEIKGKNVKLNF